MSWMKKKHAGTSSPAVTPPVQMYNPNQHETQWHNQQVHDNWYNQSQQQPQHHQLPNQEQQVQQSYYQQYPYNPQCGQQQYQQNQQQGATGYYQGSPNYNQQSFNNMQYNQTYNQNNAFSEVQQPQQQQMLQQQLKTENDTWNWEWGDEDNSNVKQEQKPPHAPPQHQQNVTKTANTLGANLDDAFGNDESWNWGVEDIKSPSMVSQITTHMPPNPTDTNAQELYSTAGQVTRNSVKPENDYIPSNKPPVVQESFNKRGKLETPQWSTESQMSQESSDDVVHTSENEIHMMMSHNAAVGYSLAAQNQLKMEDQTPKPQLHENKEIVPNVKHEPDPISVKQEMHPQSIKPISMIPAHPNIHTPPMNVLLPLDGKSGGGDDTNSYKPTIPSKFRTRNVSPGGGVAQNFGYQQVNLETPPDNSEQPDPVPPNQDFTKMKSTSSIPLHRPENNEAPLINDRNQYLETGQLSEPIAEDYPSESPVKLESDTLPPPGLKRMVLGQIEGLGVGQSDDMSSQYMRRMVPGESSSPESSKRLHLHQQRVNIADDDSEAEFEQISSHGNAAVGLATPTSAGSTTTAIQPPRSATIGADTPPSVVGGTVSSVTTGSGDAPHSDGGAVGGRGRGTRTDKLSQKLSKESDTTRRDSIEGQTQDPDVSNLVNTVRNLGINDSMAEDRISNTSHGESGTRRMSRQDSSDSDREGKSMARVQRDRQSSERSKRDKDRDKDRPRDRDRDRYSPDNYRDKKHDRRRYKERRYEDDTDYFSDKEKDRRQAREDRERDYDKKYASLRREKDKERRRRDDREYGRRGEYYYRNRYEDDYDNERSSRPSSRSDSMHDSYRERGHEKDYRDKRHRDRERERERYRRQREPYNPYQGYAYDPYNPYYQQYQYYENLRRTNPQAYAEWYRKYYQQTTGSGASYGGEDRASVHSGRSSANEELAKESYSRPYDQTDSSLILEDSASNVQRLTPAKFATAHLKTSISSGRLLRILPHYPMDGQSAAVELCHMNMLLADSEAYKELSEFPGPLVKGVTHKKTIIEYCENKIKGAAYNHNLVDVDSYILMWELLILLVRQNGMVVGTDIAELLLKNRKLILPRPPSVLSTTSSNAADGNLNSEASNNPLSENHSSMQSVIKEEEVTNKFREYLLYGSGKEALEWAMNHGLWGHALFLASKLDKRTYANVMMRFANGLTMNDPLQTLYQLLSGKMPAAVTCVADEKWGDWRPHLAMILSNSTQRPELNCKAITALGDTLRQRGSLYAAQFCYLMAETGFGSADDPETRMVLLGADHRRKPYPLYASTEAIYMTEIYEYACGLNDPGFVIPQFQIYKYLLASRLADYGLLEKSLNYLEKISNFIISDPSSVQPTLVELVCEMADRLKFHDPMGEDVEDDSQFGGAGDITGRETEVNRLDHSWLKNLKNVKEGYRTGAITHQIPEQIYTEPDLTQSTYSMSNSQETWQSPVDQQQYQPVSVQQQPWQQDSQQNWQQQEQLEQQENQLKQQPQNDFSQSQYQQNPNYWSNQQQWNDQLQNQYHEGGVDQQQPFYESNNAQIEETSPQISLPNQNSTEYNDPSGESTEKNSSPPKVKPPIPSQEKTQTTGWFGGIFSRLALKPKNQMKLPDDKNPKIVWDQDKKRWVNLDDDPNDPVNEVKPPPKMSDLTPRFVPQAQQNIVGLQPMQQTSHPVQATTPPSIPSPVNADIRNPAVKPNQPNMFKLQRGRNLKNSYVDVFSQSGSAKPASSAGAIPPPVMPSGPVPQMNFFIPQPVANPDAPVDFITPGGAPQMNEAQVQ